MPSQERGNLIFTSVGGIVRAWKAARYRKIGLASLSAGLPQDAERHFRRALALDPRARLVQSHLGKALLDQGRLDEAESALNRALEADRGDTVSHNRIGTLFRRQKKYSLAEAHFTEAIRISPSAADAYINLGAVLYEQGKGDEAEQSFRKAVQQEPEHAVAWCNLGRVLSDNGKWQEAEECFRTTLKADPDYFYARLTLAMNELKEVYEDEDEIVRSRTAYERALEDLRRHMPKDELKVAAAAEAIGSALPFLLPYQGKNDRELQRAYGEFVCELMAKRYPKLATVPPMPAIDDGRLRIGVVSGFFCNHSVWKMPVRGWIQNIDDARFEIIGYYTGDRSDADTEQARRNCSRFVEGLQFDALAEKIRADRLHAIVFPEIGMDAVTTKLATLRLAPVQCNSWGHPVTSGMPTIDYYLSSELMEPITADDFYTERLIRLPSTSVHYTPPPYSYRVLRKEEIGLRDTATVFFCAQSWFKYLPQYDLVFPRIARRIEDSQFIFISSLQTPHSSEKFRRRIARAFEREGIDSDRHIVVLSSLDGSTYHAVARSCDIFLDSIGWSGCNSSLECMACGLPVVAYEGSTMRGRHTYAFLKVMGMEHLIATDVNAYIELAVRLARDSTWRREVRREIAERLPRLYGDMSCVRALEAFLQKAVSQKVA